MGPPPRFGIGLPGSGPLFPYLRSVRAGDRATEFKQRCVGLKIKGVTLHSYRYAWAERAKTAGYPERFAMEHLGQNSKAVRAVERVSRATSGKVTAIQGDIRELEVGLEQFDIICAAAVLHHLRSSEEWRSVFVKMHATLKPGGSFWISDLIEHTDARVQALMWERYGNYLKQLKDEAYRDRVFAYIVQEDTPRPLMFQLDLLRAVGFSGVEVLHKSSCFAAFGAFKANKTC